MTTLLLVATMLSHYPSAIVPDNCQGPRQILVVEEDQDTLMDL